MALHFDDVAHRFTRDGLLVPSVTQVIGAAGLISQWTTQSPEPRERGVRVHRALYQLTQASEDAALAELEPGDLPYFEAGQWWMVSAGVEVIGAEELVDGGTFAGWRDLRCRIRGRERPVVVDLKTGALPAWVGLQLAAYAHPLPEPHDRLAVRLQPNGEPLVKPFDALGDWSDFRSCLRVWQLQQQMGTR